MDEVNRKWIHFTHYFYALNIWTFCPIFLSSSLVRFTVKNWVLFLVVLQEVMEKFDENTLK